MNQSDATRGVYSRRRMHPGMFKLNGRCHMDDDTIEMAGSEKCADYLVGVQNGDLSL